MAIVGRAKYIRLRAKFGGEATRGERPKNFRASFVLRLLEISRARVCISPGPQSPSPSQSKITLAFPTISEPGTG